MIGVVAHDAGGAEVVSSYIRRSGMKAKFCLDGPATQIFERKLGSIKNSTVEELVDTADWIICGTSGQSDLEWRVVGLSRQKGKRCVVMLDHWVNYRKRFVRSGKWNWPDEVWVGDTLSARIAATTIPEVKIVLVPNAYFMDIKDEVKNCTHGRTSAVDGVHVLYVCEPINQGSDDSAANICSASERNSLIYFLKNIHCLGNKISRIVIRPHPKESKEKYDWVHDEFDLPIICAEEKSLLEQISISHIVAGCATMGMVVGLLAGKRVVSCIAPGVKLTALPHDGIEDMATLIAKWKKLDFENGK